MVRVERSQPAPESLEIEKRKVTGKYNLDDVMQRLKEDFSDKCYICNLGDLPDKFVEHLRPHKNGKYVDLKFDWNNLFLSCFHCNTIKNNRIYDDKILDCCKENPEDLLEFVCKADTVEIRSKSSEEKEVMTAKLLTNVFNSTNTNMRDDASKYRVDKLYGQMNQLYKCLSTYDKNPSNKKNLRILQALLSRKSDFAAFKRAYIRNNISTYEGLKGFLV